MSGTPKDTDAPAGFLGRWSRRKQDAREGLPLAEPTPVPAAVPITTTATTANAPTVAAEPQVAPTEPPPPTLAEARALTPASDFKPFVARGVAPEVRNAAMKQLFADPHFNVMDRLDIYIDDYGLPDPLPESMLRKMASAHFLGLFNDEETPEPAALPEAGATLPAESVAQSDASRNLSGAPAVIPSEPSQPLPLPAAGASHTDHAHADLRLQPDHAAPDESPGRGTG